MLQHILRYDEMPDVDGVERTEKEACFAHVSLQKVGKDTKKRQTKA